MNPALLTVPCMACSLPKPLGYMHIGELAFDLPSLPGSNVKKTDLPDGPKFPVSGGGGLGNSGQVPRLSHRVLVLNRDGCSVTLTLHHSCHGVNMTSVDEGCLMKMTSQSSIWGDHRAYRSVVWSGLNVLMLM